MNPSLLAGLRRDFPFAMATSICLSTVTICSGLYLCIGILSSSMRFSLSTPPEEIPKLIEALDQGYSIAIGRFQVKRHPVYRRATSRIKRTVEHWIYRTPGRLYISGFMALDGEVARHLSRTAPIDLYLPAEIYELLPLEQIVNVDVRHERSRVGRSRYGIWRSLKFLFNLVRQGFR